MSDYCDKCGSEFPGDVAIPSDLSTLPAEAIRRRHNSGNSMGEPATLYNDVDDMLEHYDEAAAKIAAAVALLDDAINGWTNADWFSRARAFRVSCEAFLPQSKSKE